MATVLPCQRFAAEPVRQDSVQPVRRPELERACDGPTAVALDLEFRSFDHSGLGASSEVSTSERSPFFTGWPASANKANGCSLSGASRKVIAMVR